LSDASQREWNAWKSSLRLLEDLRVPRTYTPASLSNIAHREVYVYSDASEKAIAVVAYLKSTDNDGNIHVGFLLGKSKVAPHMVIPYPVLSCVQQYSPLR
jgi:hypothetical protein